MKIGNILREFVDKQFPDRVSRTVTYNDNEAELSVKFKNNLPTAIEVGLLTSTALMEMAEAGYPKFGNIWTSIEGGLKMSVTIKAKSMRLSANVKPPTDEPEFEEEDTVGNAFESKEEEEYKPPVTEEIVIDTKKEDNILSLTLAMEYGYLQCEKGNNLTQALINFENTLKGKK